MFQVPGIALRHLPVEHRSHGQGKRQHLEASQGAGIRVKFAPKSWANSKMGVSKNRATPKWMVKIRENPIKMDDLGVALYLETPK